ncbi:MAG: MmgE/PrpD family protein [Burkholderiaceae bacterium]
MPKNFAEFVHQLRYEDLPSDVLTVLRRSVVDTMGVAIVGSSTGLSEKARLFARRFWAAGEGAAPARILFDGHVASAAGAAMAGAFTIDSIDAHDGYSAVKGHAGSAIFPGVIAAVDMLRAGGQKIDGPTFITAIAAGYEVAYRSGLTLHATTPDYHTSGAWTAVGVAAAVAKLIGLDAEGIRQAAGIAEYHGPRSQMMRCIDHPTMVRDGVGWGAPTGVSSALLAQLGFTGAPAITAEGEQAAPFWADLGERWEIMNTHYKPYPVCRWAHSAIDAAADLMRENKLGSKDIERVRIQTFHYATRLAGHDPQTLDEMTYSIAFPVAVMIVRGKIGAEELDPAILKDEEVRRVSRSIELVETEHYTRISTRLRWADVTLYLKDGRVVQSDPRTPRGDPELPLSDEEISGKYHRFADLPVGRERADEIERLGNSIDSLGPNDFGRWLDLVHLPVGS